MKAIFLCLTILSLWLLMNVGRAIGQEPSVEWCIAQLRAVKDHEMAFESARNRVARMHQKTLIFVTPGEDGDLWLLMKGAIKECSKMSHSFNEDGFKQIYFARINGVVPNNMSGGIWLDSVFICEIRKFDNRKSMNGKISTSPLAVVVNRKLFIVLPPSDYRIIENSHRNRTGPKEPNE